METFVCILLAALGQLFLGLEAGKKGTARARAPQLGKRRRRSQLTEDDWLLYEGTREALRHEGKQATSHPEAPAHIREIARMWWRTSAPFRADCRSLLRAMAQQVGHRQESCQPPELLEERVKKARLLEDPEEEINEIYRDALQRDDHEDGRTFAEFLVCRYGGDGFANEATYDFCINCRSPLPVFRSCRDCAAANSFYRGRQIMEICHTCPDPGHQQDLRNAQRCPNCEIWDTPREVMRWEYRTLN